MRDTLMYSDFVKAGERKVFCRNCSFYHVECGLYRYAKCKKSKDLSGLSNKGQFISLLIEWKEFKNTHNTCKEYKRKWWKFWVRKDGQ